MNSASPGTLTARELALIRADIAGLVQDSDSGEQITLKRQGNRAFDPASGQVSYSETSTTLTAHRSLIAEDEGEVRRGDVRWIVVAASLTAVPQPGDRLLAGSEVWSIYRVDEAPLSATYVLFSRRA